MEQRLQKILSARGVASRRAAEEMILSGKVTVNGVTATLGQRADPDVDLIEISGQVLPALSELVYIMLNKPRGIVTTLSDERGRPNAAQLVADCGQRVWPIGRLDMDTEGLLLFTNDGLFSQAIAHPKGEIEKCYHVWVKGYTQEKGRLLNRQIVLDGYRIAKPKVRVLGEEGVGAKLEIIIHEGRNRQVRRMCAAAGLKVERLLRVREGGVSLGNLPSGAWRYLTRAERIALTRDDRCDE